MSDFTLVDPKGWDLDLHSVYSAYIGYFQVYNIPWYDRSWGHHFATFDDFLAFSWPAITVTDAFTGRAHIVTRATAIAAFLKMIKTRFGETIPQAPNILHVTPFETTQRHLRHITDYSTYRKLHGTLPAIVLAALKTRIKGGDPKAIRELWQRKDKTFLAVDFEWNEKNSHTVLEWGFAAVRCGHLDAKGHYVIADYVDKLVNKHCPNYPWHYAFGDTQVIPKSKLPQVIQSVVSSLASPDSETSPNDLVLVAHGLHGDMSRLEEMKIKLPHNMLVIDVSVYERSLFSANLRGPMVDPNTGAPRASGVTLSLEQILASLALQPLNNPPNSTNQRSGSSSPDGSNGSSSKDNLKKKPQLPLVLPQVTYHNAGNDAVMTLFAFQRLLQHDTPPPSTTPGRKSRVNKQAMNGLAPPPVGISHPPSTASPNGPLVMSPTLQANGMLSPMGMSMPMSAGLPMAAAAMGSVPMVSGLPMGMAPPPPIGMGMTNSLTRSSSAYDLASEFGQMQLQQQQQHHGGGGHGHGGGQMLRGSGSMAYMSMTMPMMRKGTMDSMGYGVVGGGGVGNRPLTATRKSSGLAVESGR